MRIQNDTQEDSSPLEQLLSQDERIKSVSAVFHETDLLVGVRVSTFHRFHKSKIDNELKKELEDIYNGMDVTVSADSKILYEATKLIREDKKENFTKEIDDLKSLLKEET